MSVAGVDAIVEAEEAKYGQLLAAPLSHAIRMGMLIHRSHPPGGLSTMTDPRGGSASANS